VTAGRRLDRHRLALPQLGPAQPPGEQDRVQLGAGQQGDAQQVEPAHQDQTATERAEDR
jgi:hypothetical protein